MLYALVPGRHVAVVGDDLVMLDVPSDAYACVRDGAARARPRGPGVLEVFDPADVATFAAAGFLSGAPAVVAREAVEPYAPRACQGSLLGEPLRPLRPRQLAMAAASLLDVLLAYRGRSFAAILAAAAAGRCASPRPACAATRRDLIETVATFHSWIPFLPVSGKCLLRSFMLLRRLQRRGHRVDWVFAVRTWPFAAHCWLEADGLCLDEWPERVRGHARILVLSA